jgi:hypothetical protein
MAIKVTDILKDILIAQGKRGADKQAAVRQILEEVRKQVIAEIAAAPADSFTAYRQQQMLREINRHLYDTEASLRVELGKGISESWDAGKAMLKEMAAAGSDINLTTFGISSHVVDQIKEFTWGKISAITNDAQAKIRAEISLGLLGQQTPQEVAGVIAGTLEKPGIFKGISERAEVITKTEMGRTFSMAAQKSFESAADTLPEMQKMWLHAGHPKSPRIYHLNLNGDIKDVDQPFLVGNISMMYPRDPTAPVSEIINCGCMHVPYMAEWGTKKEFLKSWEKAQKAANKPKEA